ncbi:MAG: 2-hydroxyacyl-CoA dehydratase family protein [Bryobacteraceae bacterium]
MSRIAGITSNTVPWEILRAAGYSPRLLGDEPGPTPFADRFMEDVFERRFRVIFDRLCSGAWNDLDIVVLPRTSEQEHKLYLYLREMTRLGYSERVPKLYLYNLLHTRAPESYDYGLERTRQMVQDFQASDQELRIAIAESNRARAIVREILRLRREGRMEGSVAVDMIAGFYNTNRDQFAEQAQARLVSTLPVVSGSRPRILFKGSALDHSGLHRLVEQHGGYVVAEDDWHGSRAAGDTDIQTDGDPVAAIFHKYFLDAVSPRVRPPAEVDAWFHREIEESNIQGVIFYIPLEDDVVGWDYPRQLAFLQSKGLPSLLIRDSVAAPVSEFLKSLPRK